MVCYAIYQGFGRMNARRRELDSPTITPLPTKMLCCSSFSLFNRSGLFFFALSAIVEVLSLLLSDSRHKICSCSCSKIISLRPPLLIVCTLGNRLFTALGNRCWLFYCALCSFVLLGYLVMGVDLIELCPPICDVSQVICATLGNRCLFVCFGLLLCWVFGVGAWINIAEEIDMAAWRPIAGSGDLFDVDFAAAGFGVRPMFTQKACLGNFSNTDEPAKGSQ